MDDTGKLIKAAALDRAEELFEQLVGQPKKHSASEWRHGTKGSFSMAMRGTKRGLWKDHESGEGGDIFDLVAVRHLGLTEAKDDFPETLRSTAGLLGIGDVTVTPAQSAELKAREAAREVAREAEEAAKAQRDKNKIKWRQKNAESVTGTMAETYLRSRGITRIPPETFANYNSLHDPELVVWATDDRGVVQGGQGIALVNRKLKKENFAKVGGYPARLPADTPNGPLFVAEGPETALTVWQATGAEVWAVFGASNFAKAPLPTDRTVILCPDADDPNLSAGRSFADACAYHAARGVRLYIAHSGLPEGSKGDLNDVLQTKGAGAVCAAIEAAKPFHDPNALPNASEARKSLTEAVEAFHKVNAGTMSMTDDLLAPLHILEASLGLGKTTTALKATAQRIRQLRNWGDSQGAAVVLVPMHRLSEQVKVDLQSIAPELTVEILRGVEAQDPRNPSEKVCKFLDEYRKRQALLMDPPCEACPHAADCLFMIGKKAKADIYIQAHGAIASKPAPTIKWRDQYLDHVVMDESPLSAMLFGTEGVSGIGLAAWRTARLPTNPDNATDLATWRANLEVAAIANGEGPLSALWLDAAGINASVAREAASLEWARKVKEKRKLAADLKQNLTVRKTAGIWLAIADLLESGKGEGGRLYVRGDTEKGMTIEHQGVRAPHEGYNTAPILALDATADAAVAEAVLRRPAARVDVIRAAEPMLRITQDSVFSGSKALLVDSPTEKGKKACANNRRRLETFLTRKARKIAPERLLVIGNKSLLELLELPDNVVTAHFNALRGLNDFQDVAAAVIVGRPQPNEQAVNRMASAIFNRHVDDRINWQGQAKRQTVNGPVSCKASIHPETDAQRVLTLTRDAEVEQAIGRLRAVNRTKPVEVLLLSDAIIRQTVELAPVWAEEVRKADPVEMMLLEGGMAFLSPAHAAKAYPERWKSLNAAKYALGDLTSEKRSLRSLYDLFSLVEVEYRLPRARENAVVLVDTSKHPDIRHALEKALNCALAHFEVLATAPTPSEVAVNDLIKILINIEKTIGYRPKVTVREVETTVFVPGQIPAKVLADALHRRYPQDVRPLGKL